MRRRVFLAQVPVVGGGLLLACDPAEPGRSVGAADVYVSLARAQAVAVVDAVTDTVRTTISLSSLGERGRPWQISVAPSGSAAILPLTSRGATVGLVEQPDEDTRRATLGAGQSGGAGGANAAGRGGGGRNAKGGSSTPRSRRRDTGARACSWVRVGSGADARGVRPTVSAPASPALAAPHEAALLLTADAQGHAYAVVGSGAGDVPSSVAVLDLSTGSVLRHLPLAEPGETVLSLAVHPGGSRLYAGIWAWADPAGTHHRRGAGRQVASGRLVSMDTKTGRITAQAPIPAPSAVIDLALAAPPPGVQTADPAGLCVYGVVAASGPNWDEDDWWGVGNQFTLTALDAAQVTPVAEWPLPSRPAALAVRPDGQRVYLLQRRAQTGPWSRELVSLDLGSGVPRRQWGMPDGCFALALSPVGKAYVADVLGDRLWRIDTRSDTLLGSMPLPGAPVALAARPA